MNQELIERLHSILRPFLLRRLKADVEKSLLPKIEHVVPCPLSKRQRELYEDFMAAGATRNTLAGGSFLGIMNVLMQLRKVCNHPDLFEERPIRSPHAMDPITVRAAGFVLRALDDGPLSDKVHLDLFNLNLAAYCEIDVYDAQYCLYKRSRPAAITEVSVRTLGPADLPGSAAGSHGPATIPMLSPLRTLLQAQQERRLAWRKGVRHSFAFINERRCQRSPLYGHGLRRSVAVRLTSAVLHDLAAADVAPLESVSVIGGLVQSYEQRLERHEREPPRLHVAITKAAAPPPRLSTRHDPSEAAKARKLLLAARAAPQGRSVAAAAGGGAPGALLPRQAAGAVGLRQAAGAPHAAAPAAQRRPPLPDLHADDEDARHPRDVDQHLRLQRTSASTAPPRRTSARS